MNNLEEKIHSLLPQELLSDCIAEGYTYEILIDEHIFAFQIWKDSNPNDITNINFSIHNFDGRNDFELRNILSTVVCRAIWILENDEPS